MQAPQSTVDPSEIAKFEAMAAEWWDPTGKFKPLHMLNPCRLDYITQSNCGGVRPRPVVRRPICKGLRLLDIGCGGGLLSEPMARLGADGRWRGCGGEGNIPVAQHPRGTIRPGASIIATQLQRLLPKQESNLTSF